MTSVLIPKQGGTGTNVVPTTGQVPVGQADGTYLPGTVSGSGDTFNNTFNNLQVDQAGTVGTGSTYGVLIGAIDGSNTTFTVSEGEYVTGSLVVFVQRVAAYMGSTADFQETSPAAGTFDFNTAPQSGDRILVLYQKQSTSSDDILVSRSWVNKNSAYTMLASERGVNSDATSGAFTVTLPLASTAVDKGTYFVRKSDASGNNVTVARQGSDTIDGSTSSKTIATQFEVQGYEAVTSSAWVTVIN